MWKRGAINKGMEWHGRCRVGNNNVGHSMREWGNVTGRVHETMAGNNNINQTLHYIMWVDIEGNAPGGCDPIFST